MGSPPTHPVQQAWQEIDVAQCGYCQAGQIMSAAALLAKNPKPTDADIDRAMNGNLCRCGTYLVAPSSASFVRAGSANGSIPSWVKAAVEALTAAAVITHGPVFRAINKAGRIWGDGIRSNRHF